MNKNNGRSNKAVPSTSYYDKRGNGYNSKVNEMPCSYNVDFENRDMSLEYLRSKMDDMEPRVSGIGGKLQKISEEVEKLRELVTARRREIEDLESSVTKRVNKTEDQVATCVQEVSDHKTESLAVRQSLANIGSEISCLKKWVMDNMQEITSRLDTQDQQFLAFRNDLLKRLDRTVREAARVEVKELRYQVDAKFAAVKVALKKSGKGDLELSLLDEPLYDEEPYIIDIAVRPVDEDLLDSEFNSEPYQVYQVDDAGFSEQYPHVEPMLEPPRTQKKKCCKTAGSTRKCCKKGARSHTRSESLDSSQSQQQQQQQPRTVVLDPPGGTVYVEPDRGTVMVEPMADTSSFPVQNFGQSRRDADEVVFAPRKETGEILADILVQPATGEVTDMQTNRKSSTKKPCTFPPKRKAGPQQQQEERSSLPPQNGPRYTEVFMDAEVVLNELRKHSLS